MTPGTIALIISGISLLGSLFGGNKSSPTQTQVTTTKTPPRGYQSPMLGIYDMLFGDTLLKNMNAYNGWGGKGVDMSNIQNVLKMLGTQIPELIDKQK